jgi:hypothetical protein
MEMDSVLAEDAVNLKELLLPAGFDPIASLDAQVHVGRCAVLVSRCCLTLPDGEETSRSIRRVPLMAIVILTMSYDDEL